MRFILMKNDEPPLLELAQIQSQASTRPTEMFSDLPRSDNVGSKKISEIYKTIR
jgi:hypothetical protein